MKIQLLLATVLFTACSPFAQEIHTAKITVRVVDESGKPLTNVPVVTSVVDHFSTSGFEAPVYRDITLPTDKHGLAVIRAPGAEQELPYWVADFPSFYNESGKYIFKGATMGNWQPWNPTVQLVMEAIGVQVPMYATGSDDLAMPAQGKPVGYDLMVGDWLAPFGKGETPDFIFQWDTVRVGAMTTNYLTLRFPNEGDGIQFVAKTGTGLILPRLAPVDGYEPMLIKWESTEHGTNARVPFVKGDSNYRYAAWYLFRIRTKMDSNGKIVSAFYGKLTGDDFGHNLRQGKFDFTYCLNPEPNSRNMEFDPKRNLFGKPSPFKPAP